MGEERRAHGASEQRGWQGNSIEISSTMSTINEHPTFSVRMETSYLIRLYLRMWGIGKQTSGLMYFRKMCTSVRHYEFLRMLPRLENLPVPSKFNILLQSELEFKVIL